MADTTISSVPATVTETDAVPAASVLTIDSPIYRQKQNREYVIILKVVTGTVQFAVGAAPGASNPSYTTTDDAIAVTVNNEAAGRLQFLASAQNDAFTVTT